MFLNMQYIALFDLSIPWKSFHMWPFFVHKWQILKSQRICHIPPPRRLLNHVYFKLKCHMIGQFEIAAK